MALNYQIMLKQNFQDLNPLFIGEAELPEGYKELATARSCSVLYYTRRGCGTVRIGDTTYRAAEGQFFLIPVGIIAEITASENCSWHFQWIGFNGTLAVDFLQLPTTFSLPETVTVHLYDLQEDCSNIGSRVSSDLLLIHSVLTKPKPDRTDHVQKVVDHILSSYMFKVSVDSLAAELGINSCYLSRRFTQKMGCSIRSYLLQVRISNAKNYLNQGYSVKEAALLCGFQDVSNFSKLFKKETGFAPTHWVSEMAGWWEELSPTASYPPKKAFPFAEQKKNDE